jgi:hypothetical protein
MAQYATRALSTRDQNLVAKLRKSSDPRHLRLADRLEPQVSKPSKPTKAQSEPQHPPTDPGPPQPAQQPKPEPAQQPKPEPEPTAKPAPEGGDHKVGGMGTQDIKSDPPVAKPTPSKGR